MVGAFVAARGFNIKEDIMRISSARGRKATTFIEAASSSVPAFGAQATSEVVYRGKENDANINRSVTFCEGDSRR